MTPLELALRLVAGVLLILANGFFVAIEFALTRARQFTEAEFIGDRPSLRRAWDMTDDLELYLTTCQVGITASSIAVGIVAEPALAALFEPLFGGTFLATVGAGALLAYFIINLIHLTHGEQTPTYLGVERSRFVCRYGATPLYYFYRLISPLITLGDYVAKGTLKLFGVEMTGAWLETEEDVIESRADLRNRLGSVLEEGDLSDERREEVLNALRIGERPVREVMVPPEEIVALSTAISPEENFERMAERPHTRYPLVGEDLTDYRGVVYFPALARRREALADGTVDFEALAAPPVTLSPDMDVSDAIDQFQVEGQELALVVEDSGASETPRASGEPASGEVVGMVTVTDLLESVTGEIEDPLDQEIDAEDTAGTGAVDGRPGGT
jgi:CBS domain containing-hemolysin-like protein